MSPEASAEISHQTARAPLPRLGEIGRLAGFEVVAKVGRGARSTVYRVRRDARHTTVPDPEPGASSDGPPVEYALKILDFSLADSAEALIAFRREAALLAGVNHPGLTRVHEVGTASGQPYLVMDLVTGQSLAEVLNIGALSPARVIALALDIVDPLAAVHRRGLIHRDVKPPNIMVLADGEARLIDFGLTAREGEGESTAAVGTFAYCAPEQSGVLKRPVDNRSDLYSLGVVLFESLAGVLPFSTADVGELLRMHALTPAPDLCDAVPGTPRGLADAVARLLAKDPDDRYQNGEDLAADLRALAGSEQLPAVIGRAEQIRVRPMSGRDRELAELDARWNQAREGRGGVCVVRGSGRSMLANELVSNVRAAGGVLLRGKCSPDDPVPFGPLRTALEDHLRALDRIAADDRRREHARIRAACDGGTAGLLTDLTPALSAILNRPDGSDRGDGSDRPKEVDRGDGSDRSPKDEAPEDQDQFALALAVLLTGLARECGSLMLVLDDVQWLDPGSRRVLTRLSPELATAAVLVVMTARDDESSVVAVDAVVAELGAAVDVDLVLGPLDEIGVAGQIEATMPGLRANARLVSLLSARSNGSPFVVQEYLRAVVDAGLLQPSWGTWVLDESGLDALELPNDALGLVIARVQRLGPRMRDLLTVAAVIGSRFSPMVLAAVRSEDLEVVLAGLVEASGHGLVEPRDGGQFAFLHDRIREALLDELDPIENAKLHGQIAEALEAIPVPNGGHGLDHVYAVARHYMSRDRQPGDGIETAGRVLAACRAAGRMALDHHAPAEAVGFLEYAAVLGNPQDSEFPLLLGIGLKREGRLVEAREWLEQALEAEVEPLSRAEILILIAEVHRELYDVDAGRQTVDRGLAELGADLPRNPLALTASTVVRFVAAALMQWTGIRVGSATGRKRRRNQAIAGLHEEGIYLNAIGLRPGTLLVHLVRSLYWSVQLGWGPYYVWSQVRFEVICTSAGLHAGVRQALARVDADPASDSPPVRAKTAWSRGMATYLVGHDNGEELRWGMETQGRWLDLGSYLDGASILITEACAAGRTSAARYWLAQGQRRMGERTGLVMAFTYHIAMTEAVSGRTAQAGIELRRLCEAFAGPRAPGLDLLRVLTTLVVLAEQGEFGAPFDDVVAEFEAMKLTQAQLIRPYRNIHFQIALGRLAQLRSAEPADRSARLAAARQAVRQVVKAPRIDALQARGLIVRADLLVLENQPQQALKVLARLPAFLSPDAPRLPFEAARIRARAVTALGGAEEADRQAQSAMSIAQAQGWPHWIRAITSEFAVAAAERSSMSGSSVYSTGRPGGVQQQRLEALQQVSAAASRVLDPGVLARIALDETIRILTADRAFLFLTDGPGEVLVPHLGRDAAGQDVPELTGYSASLVERVRETRTPLVVTGTEEGAALGAQSVVLHGLRSIMVAPLELEGRLLGVVYLDSQVAKGIFTSDDVGILTALTNHIATSLETTRAAQLEISVQTARQQRDLADTLRQSLESMSETLDPVEVTKRLFDAVVTVLPCDGAWVLSADGAEAECVLIAKDSADGQLVREAIPGEPRLRALLAREQPSIGSPESIPLALTEKLASATSWICVPLRSHDAKTGILVLASTAPDAHLDAEIEVAAALAAQGIAAYDKAVLFTQVQELAVVDDLTGIANRRRFFEVAARDLAAALRHGRPLTALMIDIDHFKRVNDTYGHPTGDDVIRAVAQRLYAQVRETDILGRYGGEEFALLLSATGPNDDLPERLRAGIADTPITTRSGPVDVTVSIGLANLTPSDDDVTTFLARADQALYRAKQEGRNRIRGA